MRRAIPLEHFALDRSIEVNRGVTATDRPMEGLEPRNLLHADSVGKILLHEGLPLCI